MSTKSRHFLNTFDDYKAEFEGSLVEQNKLKSTSKLAITFESKWEQTLVKFQQLDFSDYSVYTGTSGVALLKLLKNPHDHTNLQEVKQLLSLRKLKNSRVSFLCGDSGPLAIGAVVNHRLGIQDEVKQLVEKLLSLSDDVVNFKSDLPNEYLYGRAGYLFSLLYVNKHIQPSPISKDIIRQIIDAIIRSGKSGRRSSKINCPLVYQWHDSYYLGAAHGISGIMYLLLQAKEYLTDTELDTLVKPTVDYLASLKFPSGNYPSSLGSDSDKHVQWCHGAPGFVFLFSAAFKAFKDPNYLNLALEAAEVVWNRGLVRKGYSICHGVSGNAYCFLELYQTTGDEKHLYRGTKFAEWCLVYDKEHEEYTPDRPLSLFEGITGPMYLLVDIQNPNEAKFPGFTI